MKVRRMTLVTFYGFIGVFSAIVSSNCSHHAVQIAAQERGAALIYAGFGTIFLILSVFCVYKIFRILIDLIWGSKVSEVENNSQNS